MRLLAMLCAGLATLALALGYSGQALWAGSGICAAIGLLWLGGRWRGWDWAADPCLAGWVAMAALGAWQGVPSGWMLAGLTAALAAWDLDHFAERLSGAGVVTQYAELTRAHLRRLAIVGGMGLLLSGIALVGRFELTFGWTILLAALAIVGVSGVIRSGRSGEQ
jgi:hypothetical protein